MGEKLIDRIELIANDNERSIRAFEMKIGISSGYIYQMKKNKGNIGIDVITNILETYPKYNLEWLITGNGEIYKNEADSPQNIEAKPEETTEIKIISKKIDDITNM